MNSIFLYKFLCWNATKYFLKLRRWVKYVAKSSTVEPLATGSRIKVQANADATSPGFEWMVIVLLSLLTVQQSELLSSVYLICLKRVCCWACSLRVQGGVNKWIYIRFFFQQNLTDSIFFSPNRPVMSTSVCGASVSEKKCIIEPS